MNCLSATSALGLQQYKWAAQLQIKSWRSDAAETALSNYISWMLFSGRDCHEQVWARATMMTTIIHEVKQLAVILAVLRKYHAAGTKVGYGGLVPTPGGATLGRLKTVPDGCALRVEKSTDPLFTSIKCCPSPYSNSGGHNNNEIATQAC